MLAGFSAGGLLLFFSVFSFVSGRFLLSHDEFGPLFIIFN